MLFENVEEAKDQERIAHELRNFPDIVLFLENDDNITGPHHWKGLNIARFDNLIEIDFHPESFLADQSYRPNVRVLSPSTRVRENLQQRNIRKTWKTELICNRTNYCYSRGWTLNLYPKSYVCINVLR